MKNKIILKIYFLVFLATGLFTAKAQGVAMQNVSSAASNGWAAALQPSKFFIENQGQFKLPASSDIKSPVQYAFDEGTTRIFFTKKGIVYSFLEKKKKEEKKENRKFKSVKDFLEQEKEEKDLSCKTDVLSVSWEGANEDVQIISEDRSQEYFSYAFNESGAQKNINHIYGFKKLTYKNLYPDIDVEYVFYPAGGIKYSLIIHPGADVSVVKMKYSGKLKLDDKGDISLSTKFGYITEHAPQTFYAGNKAASISSKFVKTGRSVSFQLEAYNKSQTVVIDPWVQTPTIANSNCVWECEKDGAGNIFIIGGDSPMKLLKYDATGALQWTYTTPWDTANNWLGTLATDLAGNSYVTSGSKAAITKISPGGSQLYNVTGGSFDEYWNISFNCDQTKLVVGGTRLNSITSPTGDGVIFDINTATGSVNSLVKVGTGRTYTVFGLPVTEAEEVRSITSAYNARYYYLTLDSLGTVDQNFSACPTATSLFKINNSYAFSYKCENYRPQNGNSGIMAVRANKNFVYTQNGATISKRSLMTGAVINTVAIPGGISTASMGFNQPGNSGIDIDSCGNVYVGSGNAVVKYDQNLNQLSSVALPFAVYDVAVSYGGNVIVCGATGTSSSTSRTGYVQSVNMTACNPMTLFCCDATICPAGPFCTTGPSFTITPVTPGGVWSGTGVNASGVFNPATAGAGIHTIVYALACGSDSIQITVNPCATLTVCIDGSGNLNVSGGTPGYTWQEQVTVQNCSACFSGCNFPPGCATSTTTWTTLATNTSTFTPTGYPVKVIDNVGNSYTVTTSGSVPACSNTCTTPTVSIISTNSVTCFGASTGGATVTATPAGTYTYTWQSGNLNGPAQSGLAAGIYTITASSSSTCSVSTTVNITQPATALSASITAISPASCGQNNGSMTVTPGGGTSGYTYSWTPTGGTSATASNLAGGSYTVTVTDANFCTVTAAATLASTSTPTLSVNNATVCAGNTSVLTVSGANTYSWSPATGLSATTGSTVTANPTITTIYTVTGTAGTCSSTATSTVSVNAVPTATATGTALVCTGQTINLGVTTNATNYMWSGPNSFSSTIQNPSLSNAAANNSGVYTVTVSANGCSAVSSLSVTVTNSTSVTITPAGPFCNNAVATNLNASVAGGVWSGTGITNTANGTFDPSIAGVGTFTITYTISGSCGSKDSSVITVNASPTATATATTLVCVGQAINLGVNATAGANYNWSGPMSYTSNLQNPVITNAVIGNGGTYTVTVSAGSCTAIDTISVNVVSNPTITVSSATVCAGTTATLTANGASTYTWSPATGLSTSTGSVVVAAPATTSVYTVSGGLGTCSAIQGTATVTVNPTPTVTVNNSSLCSSTSVTITAGGANTYSWTPGTGLSATTGSTVTANSGSSTNYTVIGTDINGCLDSSTFTVPNSPSITATTTSSSVTCNGLSNGSATVTPTGGTGPFTYSWTPFGGTNSVALNISAGSYTCTITDSQGCIATTTVSVIQPISLAVNVTSGIICAGQSYTLNAVASGGTLPYTYIWNGGAYVGNPYVVSPGSAAAYTVVVTDANGCTTTDTSIVVAVRPPLQVIVGDANICAGNSTTLIAIASGGNGTYSYNWMPGNLSGSNISVSPASTTIYTVTVTDGCTTLSSNDTGRVNVTSPPVIPMPNPSSGCAPLCVTFTNPPGLVNWQWNFGDSAKSNQVNPTHCYTTAGSFNISISYTTGIGCASQATSNNVVNVYPVPHASFVSSPNPTNILDPHVLFYNQSINSNSWQWAFGDGSSSTLQNPGHTYTEPGIYPVILIAETQQGCRDTVKELLVVNDIFTFYAPNAFTPNEDDMDEVFKPVGEGWNNSTYSLWIFDRWGNMIFKSQDPNKGWDGRIHAKGDILQEDVYVWKVQLNDIFGMHHQYEGTVSLVK